jgi:GR25 family glycosyltransferase involved in LPS biosynthesis
MEVYIINLSSQTKRKEHMEQLMRDMYVEKYQFVTPKPLEDHSNLSKIKKAELSLLQTNIEIFQKVISSPNPPPYILVFEDDIKPTIPKEQFIPKIKSLLNQVPTDWDIIYLEYCGENCFLTKKISNDISKASGPLCTAAILYNTQKLNKIIAILQNNIQQTIDRIYLRSIKDKNINAYISTPPLFIQDIDTFETTINPYYIVRSIYGYQSCNTHIIINIVILVILFAFAIYFIFIR